MRRILKTGRSATHTRQRSRRGATATAIAAAAALLVIMTPAASAFPPEGGQATGFGSTDFDDTAANRLTTCQNTFSGEVTVNAGSGQGGEIRIDEISFSPCDPKKGISVIANDLPWTLKLDSRANLTIEPVDLSIVKAWGRCHYTGMLEGARSFDGVYTIFGALARHRNGCDGPRRLGVSVLAESISVDGVPLVP